MTGRCPISRRRRSQHLKNYDYQSESLASTWPRAAGGQGEGRRRARPRAARRGNRGGPQVLAARDDVQRPSAARPACTDPAVLTVDPRAARPPRRPRSWRDSERGAVGARHPTEGVRSQHLKNYEYQASRSRLARAARRAPGGQGRGGPEVLAARGRVTEDIRQRGLPHRSSVLAAGPRGAGNTAAEVVGGDS